MSKSPSLRRIQADVRELAIDPSDRYHAAPLEDDMFEWHFTIRGADETEFEGGVYHGRILLPPEYPFKPPHIVFLTPSGRFETGTKVCLSFSAHHPELWQPAWGIRLILEALISFLPTPADGAIGALDWTKEERKRLAKKSLEYCCPRCGNAAELLPKLGDKKKPGKVPKFQKEIEQLHLFQIQNEAKNPKKNEDVAESNKDEERSEAAEEKSVNVDSTRDSEAAKPAEELDEQHADDKTEKKVAEESEEADDTALSQEASMEEKEKTGEASGVHLADEVQLGEHPARAAADADVPLLSDPVVHGIIVTFAAIVFLLYRKAQSLVEELRNLEA